MTQILFTPGFIGGMRGWEYVIIFLVILLLFGGKKIPELMRGLGKGVHSFRKGMQEAKEEMNRPIDDDEPRPAKTSASENTGKDRS